MRNNSSEPKRRCETLRKCRLNVPLALTIFSIRSNTKLLYINTVKVNVPEDNTKKDEFVKKNL